MLLRLSENWKAPPLTRCCVCRTYVNVTYIYIGVTQMHLAERLDDIGKPAWIALMIVSFII